jgi:four helix bundle protein
MNRGEMTEKQFINGHRDLLVYQKSRWLAREIFEMTNSFPKEEIHSLTSQIRHSSRSVGAQIAEAWAKRGFEKHFANKLSDADAEQCETQHWIEIAEDCGYISHEKSQLMLEKCRELGNLLKDMLDQAALINTSSTRSAGGTQAEYLIE